MQEDFILVLFFLPEEYNLMALINKRYTAKEMCESILHKLIFSGHLTWAAWIYITILYIWWSEVEFGLSNEDLFLSARM